MRAIMISVKPKWCALEMNGKKSTEIRKNKALANAIQKLIDEKGFADIFVYCTKDNYNHLHKLYDHSTDETLGYSRSYYETNNVRKWEVEPQPLNGKVLFKFRCYKVEEIQYKPRELFESDMYYVGSLISNSILSLIGDDLYNKSCLSHDEMHKYLQKQLGYAIHISDLEIFDKPKELSDFIHWVSYKKCKKCPLEECYGIKCPEIKTLTKAPQNFCYVVEEE